jgi:hypothetical protein
MFSYYQPLRHKTTGCFSPRRSAANCFSAPSAFLLALAATGSLFFKVTGKLADQFPGIGFFEERKL